MAPNGEIVAFVEMILLFKIQGKYNILHLIAFVNPQFSFYNWL